MLRLKAIWCLIWHRHQKYNDPVKLAPEDGTLSKPSAFCRKCGIYFRWPVQ
jgi:hypothetical protein